MDTNEIKSIILDTIIDVLSDLIVEVVKNRINIIENKVLVIYSGGSYGFKDSIKSIKDIIEDGYDVNVVLTESADYVLGAENIRNLLNIEKVYLEGRDDYSDILQLIDKSNVLILPSLTINSVAKIANCISDSYLTEAVSKFILMDKKIFSSRNNCCPNDKERILYSMNPSNSFYKMKMIENMETIEKYGVKFVEAINLYAGFTNGIIEKDIDKVKGQRCEKNIITRADVVNLHKGSTLYIKEKCILTELAKDQLKINGINIKRGS